MNSLKIKFFPSKVEYYLYFCISNIIFIIILLVIIEKRLEERNVNKNISEETQKKLQGGLAGVGKMYRRMGFPIYNEHKQLIGFSGRKVDDNNNYPKWKHIGRRNNWVYPALNKKTEVDEEIKTKKEVILVESIGDALALYEQNINNVLVIFGLSVNNNIFQGDKTIPSKSVLLLTFIAIGVFLDMILFLQAFVSVL